MINLTERLDNLRHALRLTWKELAAHLGVSYVMLHYVRAGKKPLGAKLEQRIRQAEEAIAAQPSQAHKTKSIIASEHDFSHLEWLDSLKRRWGRKPSDRNEIMLAIRVLFPDHAEVVLRWLKKK
jgi:transcriptional regulator with XRE-family HTH domain